MVDGRNTHHNVQDRQVRTTEYGGKKVDPKAGERKMKPAKNNEKQRNYMNHFHNTNLTLSVVLSHNFNVAKSAQKIRKIRSCNAP